MRSRTCGPARRVLGSRPTDSCVRSGVESCQPASDDEEDMLDTAPGLTLNSRLACQAVPDGSCDVVVEIPGWNRNHAKESH